MSLTIMIATVSRNREFQRSAEENMLIGSSMFADGKFHMSPGFVGSHMYEEYLKATFDMLYREGCNGSPKMMNIPMHSRILGKPGRSEALRNFMKYIKERPDVWVTTRKDIAKHFRAKFPYTPGNLAPKRPVGL